MFSKISKWLPLLVWMALIFAMSHQPKAAIVDFGGWDLLVKKLAHLFAYALLAIFAYTPTKNRWLALAIVVLYAGSDEYHQMFVAGRHGTLIDVGIDTVGGVFGILLWRRLTVES